MVPMPVLDRATDCARSTGNTGIGFSQETELPSGSNSSYGCSIMRAMVVTQFGPPEVLKLQAMSQPRPGPEDLLIEVHAAGMNPVDFKICRGAFREGRI